LKILFVIDTLDSGGKERRLTELLKALKVRKDIVFELVVMSRNIHYREVVDLGINIHYIIRKTKKDISVFRKFWKLCRIYRPDVVHCWDSMTAVYLVPTCKLLHIKLVNGMVIDSPVRQNIFNRYWLRARLTFPFSDIIVGNSQAGILAYKAPESRSIVIFNGFNFERTEKLIDKDIIENQLNITTNYLVGMVATFWENKDYPTYFEAAQSILAKRKDVTFMAIGANTDSDESKGLIDKRYIDNFRLLGKKSGIESYINSMDICILSTFTEGISNSILEYMALRKPVIATRGGGTGEIVADQETGYLVNPSNPGEMARRIESLLDDRILCEKMGSAGRSRIKNEFSIELMVAKYINMYNLVISG